MVKRYSNPGHPCLSQHCQPLDQHHDRLLILRRVLFLDRIHAGKSRRPGVERRRPSFEFDAEPLEQVGPGQADQLEGPIHQPAAQVGAIENLQRG